MLVPDPLRNGCIHTPSQMVTEPGAEEHPLILGAVVARAQVVLGGVAVDLVVDEEVDLVVPNTVDPWRDEQLGAEGGGKERNLKLRKLA